MIEKLRSQPRSRKTAIAIALVSTVFPLPMAGLHKFYLGQPVWGIIYLLLWYTPIPRLACAIDAVWYFVQGEDSFHRQFNPLFPAGSETPTGETNPQQVIGIAEALRELDRLRADGLVSEYEFEQKRRQLLDRIA
jgi:TM2 domain-containing membrane protein YozV